MKSNEKKMLLLIIVVGVILVGIIRMVSKPKEEVNEEGVAEVGQQEEKYVQVLEDGTKLNTSTKLNETKKVDGLEIGNIQLTMSGGQTTLLADVKNTSGKEVGVTAIDITLYDERGAEISTIGGVIGNIGVGQTEKLQASTTLDFANAYDFKVTIK